MKKYSYTYRKRGLPNTREGAGTVEANSYHEAVAIASKQVGEDYVIINVKKEESEDGFERVSGEDEQSDSQPRES